MSLNSKRNDSFNFLNAFFCYKMKNAVKLIK